MSLTKSAPSDGQCEAGGIVPYLKRKLDPCMVFFTGVSIDDFERLELPENPYVNLQDLGMFWYANICDDYIFNCYQRFLFKNNVLWQ